MSASIIIVSLIVILLVLHDAFETMLLPRRISRQFRFARLFFPSFLDGLGRYGAADSVGQAAQRISQSVRSAVVFGSDQPVGVGADRRIRLSALGVGTTLHPPEETAGFSLYLYMSGVIFFTLGFGDVTPVYPLGRFAGGVRDGHRFRVSRRRDQLSAGPLPGVFAS